MDTYCRAILTVAAFLPSAWHSFPSAPRPCPSTHRGAGGGRTTHAHRQQGRQPVVVDGGALRSMMCVKRHNAEVL
jgi:hypothetical protein